MVKDLEAMNVALLAKWWWGFLSNKAMIWRTFIEGVYYARRKPLREGISFRPYSQWWRSVLSTSDIVKCGISYTIGDSCSVSFWMDRWSSQLSLRSRFPQIFSVAVFKNHRCEIFLEVMAGYGIRYYRDLPRDLIPTENQFWR